MPYELRIALPAMFYRLVHGLATIWREHRTKRPSFEDNARDLGRRSRSRSRPMKPLESTITDMLDLATSDVSPRRGRVPNQNNAHYGQNSVWPVGEAAFSGQL